MLTRASWFAVGAAAGAGLTVAVGRKVKRTIGQLAPTNVARSIVSAVAAKRLDVKDALTEGRHAMRAKERELKARLDGQTDPELAARSIQVNEVGPRPTATMRNRVQGTTIAIGPHRSRR